MSEATTGAIRRGAAVAAWLLLVLSVAGCAVAPAQEMSDARLAMQAAKDAGAGRTTAEWLTAAGGELATAEQAIAVQRFDAAREHALVARGLALAARNIAVLAAGGGAARLGETRATTTALVDASLRARAEGDVARAARLAGQAARVSAEAASGSAP